MTWVGDCGGTMGVVYSVIDTRKQAARVLKVMLPAQSPHAEKLRLQFLQ